METTVYPLSDALMRLQAERRFILSQIEAKRAEVWLLERDLAENRAESRGLLERLSTDCGTARIRALLRGPPALR